MAGISDAEFCLKLIPYGFDMVTLGGYNSDQATINAGEKIISRGRPEFDIKEEELISSVEIEAKKIKDNWNGKVAVNLRSISPEPIVEISKLKLVDVVEVNAHCRQKEITDLGCGQALLTRTDYMEEFLQEVVKKSKSKVSVKIRANVSGVNEVKLAGIIESCGADYLHVDAMKPGFKEADMEIIRKISTNTHIFLIGNNSITDLKSAQKMIEAGAQGISIARAAMKGYLDFKLYKF